MRRLAILSACAALFAGAAQAQRHDISAEPNTYVKPYPVHAGQLIASELSDRDIASGVERSAEYLLFTGRAGEVVTAQVRSDIPSLEVLIRSWRSHTGKALAEGPARDAPVRLVLPKDDEYVIVVHSRGPQRFGKYLLSIGSADGAPAFDAPKPAVTQVAQASPAAATAASKAAPPKAKTAPIALPPMPVIAGVTNVRVGQSLARLGGKPGSKVELFAFIGEAGSVLQASATGAGGYGLALYTPEGDPILTTSDFDASKLSAVLPEDAIYFLAVARQNAAKPYKLDLAAKSPNNFLWGFRNHAGYEALGPDGRLAYWTCWTAPGSVLKYNLANGGVQTLTVREDGSGRWDYSMGGRPGGYSFTTRLEGATVIRTSEDGKVQTWSLDDPPPRLGAYRGYLCP